MCHNIIFRSIRIETQSNWFSGITGYVSESASQKSLNPRYLKRKFYQTKILKNIGKLFLACDSENYVSFATNKNWQLFEGRRVLHVD